MGGIHKEPPPHLPQHGFSEDLPLLDFVALRFRLLQRQRKRTAAISRYALLRVCDRSRRVIDDSIIEARFLNQTHHLGQKHLQDHSGQHLLLLKFRSRRVQRTKVPLAPQG